MIENKPGEMSNNSCCHNHCGATCMQTFSLHRIILWAVIGASIFAVGYVIGEAKGRFMDGWRDNYAMNRMHHQMMMQMQGGMMMNGQKMMMPMQGQGMMQGTGGGGMMNGGAMMMTSGSKR